MARKDVAKIGHEKFLKMAAQLNMVVVTKGGWTKLYAPGTDVAKTTRKPCIAIPNTKRVTIVEIVNWDAPLAVAHPKPSAKTVTGQINFAQHEKVVLNETFKTCKALCALKVEAPVEAPAEQPATEQVAETVAEPAAEVTEAPVAEVA